MNFCNLNIANSARVLMLVCALLLLVSLSESMAQTPDSIISIPIGGETADLKILPNGKKAYLANRSSNSIMVIDTQAGSPSFNTIIANISVGIRPYGIAIHPDGERIYVTNESGIKNVSIISSTSDTVTETLELGSRAPNGIAITPDGNRAYYCTFDGRIEVLDTEFGSLTYHTIIDRINIPLLLSCSVAITPDGEKAVFNWQGTIAHAIDVIDTNPSSATYHLVIGTPVPVISGAKGDVETSTDNSYVYATSTFDSCNPCKINLNNYVVQENPGSLEGLQRHMTLAEGGLSLLMTDLNTTRISKFNTSSLNRTGSIELNDGLAELVVTPDDQTIYVVRHEIGSYPLNTEVLMVPMELFSPAFPWEIFMPAIIHGASRGI